MNIFGEKVKWQPLSQVSALTEPGLQAVKFTLSVDRFVQGDLKIQGIETIECDTIQLNVLARNGPMIIKN